MKKQTNVTIVGHVATDPTQRETASGVKVTNFRVATNERRFDRALNEWRDGDTMFFAVSCWRGFGENVLSSVKKGQPVIIEGRLHTRSYDDKDGTTRMSLELEATALGHDLSRGVSSFTKAELNGRSDRASAAELAREPDEEDVPFDPTTGELLDGDDAATYDAHRLAG